MSYPRLRKDLDGDISVEMIDTDGDPMCVKRGFIWGVWIHRSGSTMVGTAGANFMVKHTYDEIMDLLAPVEVDNI